MIKKETFELMESIQQFFPHFEITQSKIDLWQKALNDMDYETADNHLMIYVKSNKYAPTIADIVKEPKEEEFARRSIPTASETKEYLNGIKSNRLTNEQQKRIDDYKKEIRKMLGVE
jgi:hypothetical protein